MSNRNSCVIGNTTDVLESGPELRARDLLEITASIDQVPRGLGKDSALQFEQAMAHTGVAICLSDPHQDDQPVVFANRAFLDLTGYDEDEVLGSNCRFLQGPETDQRRVSEITKALEEERMAVVEILNYRKNGEAFWNALHIGPIYDDAGKLLYYFGSQWDVTDVHVARAEQQQQAMLAREISHRMNNMFSVINSVVAIAGRGSVERNAVASDISGRILALVRANASTLGSESITGPTELGPFLKEIMSAYDAKRRVTMTGRRVLLDSDVGSVLALAIHELATNSIKYGALGADDGQLEIEWLTRMNASKAGTSVEIRWSERNGPPILDVPPRAGSGSSIMEALLQVTGGSVDREWHEDGLIATVRIPLS